MPCLRPQTQQVTEQQGHQCYDSDGEDECGRLKPNSGYTNTQIITVHIRHFANTPN
jgi:hypothetical protein